MEKSTFSLQEDSLIPRSLVSFSSISFLFSCVNHINRIALHALEREIRCTHLLEQRSAVRNQLSKTHCPSVDSSLAFCVHVFLIRQLHHHEEHVREGTLFFRCSATTASFVLGFRRNPTGNMTTTD